ncbi:uncharacterized protein LOC127881542 isoform X6 [Dreissena polymorpha]|uniref:uncharacterized protein LOC127881542 isoform X3 n=1 Tax=Dreissena polymorpha TaxID=45954 RepID=UPI00226537D1|nr:uncharacterized protein LOC127881542 isoform X3 [Dreissena polymorpha]XP_052285441.1 uncharacterized protein LOC127881542 isoform X4 [Dreissena polymorpha]XP_052285443.1 uncharacterized protein LOC127881542 isoform X6 [Dreissena polymorpha]
MAPDTNIFTDKQTNNWFKACIALNLTKDGLTDLVVTELLNVQTKVGRSCGQCFIQNLIPCPTQDVCKKRKGNNCSFHNSLQPKSCQTCDKVKQNITLLHRFKGPSWANTKAELWATDPWEIGKCYLPRDGYSSVSSVQESDFNGVVSIVLNCTHFQTCLSAACLSPPPPDKQCPLEKVRQIGRDVRHTADCKVTDADLQYFFLTLTTLLADPVRLLHDTSATEARIKLSDLQNDRLSLVDLGKMLKEANQTLTHAKEAGERFSEEAERTLKKGLNTLEAKIQAGKECLENKTQTSEQRIEKKTHSGELRLENKTEAGEQRIENKTQCGEQSIENKTQAGEQRIENKTQAGEQSIENKTQAGEQSIENKTQAGEQSITNKAQAGEQRIEKKTQAGEQSIENKTQAGEQIIENKTQAGEQSIENKAQAGEQSIAHKTHAGEQSIENKTQAGEQSIENKTQAGQQCIENKTQAGEQSIENKTQESINRINQAAIERELDEYERGVTDLLKRLVNHYRDTVCYVPLSTLDPSLNKHVQDVYATPKIHRMKIENDGRRTQQEEILTYKDCFYRGDHLCRRTYLQGEPGSGKTSFAAKLVDDWCNVHESSNESTKEQTAFVDVDTLHTFKFLFFISLRDSREQTHVTHMIRTQLIYKIYAEDEWESAYYLVLKIMRNVMYLVVQDGLDEWSGKEALPSMDGVPKDHCIVLTTSRPWKLADERIKNSQIDILMEVYGVIDSEGFSERILRHLLDETKDLNKTVKKFQNFLESHNLESISSSPMLHTLVLCTWVDDMAESLTGSSSCELYTTLLENLCKKTNPQMSYFDQYYPSPVSCFSRTKYVKPNMEHIDVIAEAAFSFLFSNEKETSLVFSDINLSAHLSESTKQFALHSGLISKRKSKKCYDNTSSFVHKTVQEFFAALHISNNTDVIDNVICEYLKSNRDSYLDISQVFTFLCGFNILAANKLSELMNQIKDVRHGFDHFGFQYGNFLFQRVILSGYREAVANKNTPIDLHLSHCVVLGENTEDLINIFALNTPRVRSLMVRIHRPVIIRSQDASTYLCQEHRPVSLAARDYADPSTRAKQKAVRSSASCLEFDLSACHNLEQLKLEGDITVLPNTLVGLKKLKYLTMKWDCKCEALDMSHCEHIEHLELQGDITVLPNTLAGLKKLKYLTMNMGCKCEALDVSHCEHIEHLELNGDITVLPNTLAGLKKLKYLTMKWDCKCEALDMSHCEHIEHLELNGDITVLPNTLAGLKKLKYLTMNMGCKCEALDMSHCEHIESIDLGEGVTLLPHSINNYKNIKCIKIRSAYKELDLSMFENLYSITISKRVQVLPKQLLINNNQELNSIGLYEFDFNRCDKKDIHTWCLLNGADPVLCADYTPVLPSIKHIALWGVMCSSTWLRSLLTTMFTLDHSVTCDLNTCDITSLKVNKSPSTDAKITTDLNNTCTFNVDIESPGLWETLLGLSVKNLSISGQEWPNNHVSSLSQSLATLSQLETLRMHLSTYIDLQLPLSLNHVTVYFNALHPSELRQLVNKLSARTNSLECRVEFVCGHFMDTNHFTYMMLKIPSEEYIPIQQELETMQHVDVERFRIYDWAPSTNQWSARDSVVDGDLVDEIVDNEFCKDFLKLFHMTHKSKIDGLSRISMRLKIKIQP